MSAGQRAGVAEPYSFAIPAGDIIKFLTKMNYGEFMVG